ncbi:protein-L-isoaspartate O-methyltransferase [Chromobacterium phragmitis]|uniref:Protein-L-isoaspartate O-methyltransferase n=1 Tax=Chromobacterium phragmitis TaxID=2202141 RepID=A0A344UJ11_9NEIS|nr:protein-L-isoaspartate O-methyltransferase [Chromobacterium phragmitis]AXE29868.1 protein-L-isoaspartate O-methyltransferase [Chromobacterium phragmitis]AXE35259.1 protein-L-isoaspartate O-methyltransferase [Chromobacterium phragmitis]
MDFEKTRFNMVEQQIRPWDVLDTNVLDLLFHVKREDFVADSQRQLAFVDTELPLPNGSKMLQPKMEARLVQDATIQPSDKILEIGTGSGYLTALLAKMGKQVVSVEIDPAQKERAAANLKKAGIANATLVEGDGVLGLPEQGPYDVIVVGGSLPVVPQELKDQLAVGGRLILVVGDLPVMACKLIDRETDTSFRETTLFETCVERLKKFEAVEPARFSF